ncbi:hypothetical protein IC220_05350 [Wolbachia endosymbiont of Pentalonia nigronervosa]|jgi:hypothetical protein|uniref:ankyrin repeat domain-containing protein n=1 Tax=Wolbachia endosymbiont of Pentalonia nigronervosa TaxID=1301914 RepID=UPI00165FF0C0|nr:ankyrin repeat domain-containing protein [Wolbachia endosymbiont of Pentalonia nigronervosa]MBD0391862.1 hypothetical protein [Wolbachia endosymbiont of Pentalonia nigronervosa]
MIKALVGFEKNPKVFEQEFKLTRRKRYDPNDINIAKLFVSIRQHCTGNPPKNKIDKICRLLPQIQNVNDIDMNDDGNTLLHVAIKAGLLDVVDLLLNQPNIDKTIKNKQGKTAHDLANQLYNQDPNWTNIIDRLNPPAQPGPSSIGQQGAQQPTSVQTHPASGLKNSLHGNIYQLKLTMLFLKLGMDKNYDFRLATEWDAAEKFDDLVFKYSDQGQTKYHFLQAKHKQDKDKKITVGDLFTTDTNGEFNLAKYFISYLKIKNNPDFQNGKIEDVIICTNIGFDLRPPAKRGKK